MTRDEMKSRYFEWMLSIVDEKRFDNYHRLLSRLDGTDFVSDGSPFRDINDRDSNRGADGISLRYRFGYLMGYSNPMIASYLDDRPCSVFEMLVALAIRIEEEIMHESDKGDRTDIWFWDMLFNLNLTGMDDIHYDERVVDRILHTFMYRDYNSSGFGSLFPTINPRADLRKTDIWYQMSWYYAERANTDI